MAVIRLAVWDFILSFMWVWSGVAMKMFVFNFLGMSHGPNAELIYYALSIINTFFFAFLVKLTKGGAYNPLNVLAGAFSGDSSNYLFTLGARIPMQVAGSITGVQLIIDTFPEIGRGPHLKVDFYRGVLTEGFLAFAIAIISLGLATKIPEDFFMKTWISSVSKLSLHILSSDLTGGCMNPASVMGWAYARGDHITKEHIFVYWIAPIEATLLAVWTFGMVFQPVKEEKTVVKSKSN